MFSRLTHEDKLAFFELMDEYFEARPNLFARQPESYHETSQSQPAAMAASAVHRTMASNPQATADLISSGLKTIPKGSQYSAASNPIIANAAGRFAASSLTSSFNNSAQAAKSPPAPPRRGISGGEDSPSPGRPAPSGGSGGLSSLMSSKRFGDVDTSSVKAAFASSFKGGKPAAAPPSAPVPAAFGTPKRGFAPPPVRRVATHTSSENESPNAPPSPPENRNNALHTQELAPLRRMPSDNALRRDPVPSPGSRQGERAEALYDYSSEAAEDINVREGDKLTIVERTSDDWWTGEINGRRGLLPASYVRIL